VIRLPTVQQAREEMIGLRGYLTHSRGVGGRLRDFPEDFVVEEILADGGIVRIGSGLEDHLRRDLPGGRFCHFALEKRDMDLFVAIERLSRALGVSKKRFTYCGTKDARALTCQLVSIEGLNPQDLDVHVEGIRIHTPFRALEPLAFGMHRGNAFRIRVTGIHLREDELEGLVLETGEEISHQGGVPNFFGHQRFGTTRCNTHVVGRHLLAGDFESAVWEYLGSPFQGEGKDASSCRLELLETRDFGRALASFPRRLNYERKMLEHLSKHPRDYLGALRRLPKNLLSIFVRAYQSYIFNLALSRRILQKEPFRPREGDVVETEGKRLSVGRDINLERAQSLCETGEARVVYPVVGYASRIYGPLSQDVNDILKAEGVGDSFFYCRQLPDISPKGSYREILCPVRDLRLRSDTAGDEGRLELSFCLDKGSYATVVLREFMKADITSY